MIVLKTRITNLTDKQRQLTWATVSVPARGVVEIEGAYPTACRKDCMRNTMEAEMAAGWLKVELVTNLPCIPVGAATVRKAADAPVAPAKKEEYRPKQRAELQEIPEGIVKVEEKKAELVNTDVRASVEVLQSKHADNFAAASMDAEKVPHRFEDGKGPAKAEFKVAGPLADLKPVVTPTPVAETVTVGQTLEVAAVDSSVTEASVLAPAEAAPVAETAAVKEAAPAVKRMRRRKK